MALLEVRDLQIHFRTATSVNRAVDGLSFDIHAGEALAVVGESGCGKSVTSMSILRLLPTPPGKIAGHINFRGEDLLKASDRRMRKLRGSEIGMIFQEPMTSLNPVFTIGQQIGESVRLHEKASRAQARERAIEMLRLVGIPSPERRVDEYPHQLSGGMRQRAMIAIALACNPALLVADEPTTALDVTIQAQILDLMQDLRRKVGSAVMLITHDLGVVAEFAERVLVMYAGRKVEEAKVADLFRNPRHPYTQGLLASVPDLRDDTHQRLTPIPGSPPDMAHPPTGCPFTPRCPHAMAQCQAALPPLFGDTHSARCWLHHPDAPRVRGVNTGVAA